MKRLLVTLILLTVTQLTIAGENRDAETVLKDAVNGVLSVLDNKEINKSEKQGKVMEKVEPVFDFSLMAKLTLGKKQWTQLDEDQKERFVNLFVEHLKNAYMTKLMLFSNAKIIYKDPIKLKKKIHIPTVVETDNDRMSIVYKFYSSHNGWKVYDFELEGVSPVRTYHSEFKHVLREGTIEDLMRIIKGKIEEAKQETSESSDLKPME